MAYEGPDNSQRTVFYVYDTNNRISEIELCGKDFSTISLAKRKFSSINDFVEIEYNGSGKESEHRVYRNGLQVSEESSKHKIEYTYNTNKQPVYIRRHGIGISNPIMTLLFANPDVADIVEVEEKTHIQYNTKGLIENKKSTVYKKQILVQNKFSVLLHINMISLLKETGVPASKLQVKKVITFFLLKNSRI